MIYAYDLDGVLAVGAPKPPKKWGRMNGTERVAWKKTLLDWYSKAPILLNPQCPKFHVITARKEAPEVRRVTELWLAAAFPGRILSLHMLQESRSIENVVRFKAEVLKTLGVEAFVEDNKKVLEGIRSKGLACKLFFFAPQKV